MQFTIKTKLKSVYQKTMKLYKHPETSFITIAYPGRSNDDTGTSIYIYLLEINFNLQRNQQKLLPYRICPNLPLKTNFALNR
jgi:hypothetical protein